MPEMEATRALVFRPLVKGNAALGTRLGLFKKKMEVVLFMALGLKLYLIPVH